MTDMEDLTTDHEQYMGESIPDPWEGPDHKTGESEPIENKKEEA